MDGIEPQISQIRADCGLLAGDVAKRRAVPISPTESPERGLLLTFLSRNRKVSRTNLGDKFDSTGVSGRGNLSGTGNTSTHSNVSLWIPRPVTTTLSNAASRRRGGPWLRPKYPKPWCPPGGLLRLRRSRSPSRATCSAHARTGHPWPGRARSASMPSDACARRPPRPPSKGTDRSGSSLRDIAAKQADPPEFCANLRFKPVLQVGATARRCRHPARPPCTCRAPRTAARIPPGTRRGKPAGPARPSSAGR